MKIAMEDITLNCTNSQKVNTEILSRHPVLKACESFLNNLSDKHNLTKDDMIKRLEDVNYLIKEINKLSTLFEFLGGVEINESLCHKDQNLMTLTQKNQKFEKALKRHENLLSQMRGLRKTTIEDLSKPTTPELVLTETDIISCCDIVYPL